LLQLLLAVNFRQFGPVLQAKCLGAALRVNPRAQDQAGRLLGRQMQPTRKGIAQGLAFLAETGFGELKEGVQRVLG